MIRQYIVGGCDQCPFNVDSICIHGDMPEEKANVIDYDGDKIGNEIHPGCPLRNGETIVKLNFRVR